jgi:hypothetical protein
MTYNNFEIAAELNGAEFDGPPGGFQFSMVDSIHELFPRGTLTFLDTSGYFKEGGIIVDGFPTKLTLGIPDQSKQISCDYVSQKSSAGAAMTPGSTTGPVIFELRHKGANLQSAIQKSYNDTIDSIVSDVVSPLGFTSTDIASLTGTGWWWRYGLTEEEFLIDVLRANMWSSDCDDTPFYVFGDSTGVLHVRSYAELFNQSSVASIVLMPNPQPSTDGSAITYAFDARPFSEGLDTLYPSAAPDERSYSEKDLSFTTKTDSTFKHAKGSGDHVPLIATKTPTSLAYLRRARVDDAETTFLKARTNDLFRYGMLPERILITSLFMPDVLAGTLVDVDQRIPDIDSGSFKAGQHYTGQWLAERVSHTWVPSKKYIITQMLLGRKLVSYPSEYALSTKAIQS